jgi:hypothetical protein
MKKDKTYYVPLSMKRFRVGLALTFKMKDADNYVFKATNSYINLNEADAKKLLDKKPKLVEVRDKINEELKKISSEERSCCGQEYSMEIRLPFNEEPYLLFEAGRDYEDWSSNSYDNRITDDKVLELFEKLGVSYKEREMKENKNYIFSDEDCCCEEEEEDEYREPKSISNCRIYMYTDIKIKGKK